MANSNQPQQTIIVKQQSSGCLVTALVFVLFGWIGVAVMALWALTKWTLRASVAPLRWGWQACVALWRWSVRGSRALTARYGWRGWAVVGGVVVVLAVLGSVLSATGH